MKCTGFVTLIACLFLSSPIFADQPPRLQPADELGLVTVGAPRLAR